MIELVTGKHPFGEARSIINMVQTVDPPTLPDDGKEEKRRVCAWRGCMRALLYVCMCVAVAARFRRRIVMH